MAKWGRTKPDPGVIVTSPAIAPQQKLFNEMRRDLFRNISVATQVMPPKLAAKFKLTTAFTARAFIDISLPPSKKINVFLGIYIEK